MNLIELERKLSHRLDFDEMLVLAKLTADHQIKCKSILDLCAHKNQQIAFRASWTLDAVTAINLDAFMGCYSDFIELYPKITNSSVQRSFTKIMMVLTKGKLLNSYQLRSKEFECCLSATFDWLLDTKTPVAVQSNALEVVFQLSPHYDWVLEELMVILQEKLVSSSPALISRAKRLLNKIN